MGLDSVELVIEVENQFGIAISDAEAQRVVTVGDLLAIINARMEACKFSRCPSLGRFLQVRRFMRDFLQKPSLRMRPSTTVVALVPWYRRRELWRSLSKLLDSYYLPLQLPQPLRLGVLLASICLFAVGASTAFIDVAILPLGILTAFAIIVFLQLALTPLRIEPPANMATMGDISLRLIGLSQATGPFLSSDEVLERLQTIVSRALGVDRDEVIPAARFIQDLDMD
jgi:acyl carrier protein